MILPLGCGDAAPAGAPAAEVCDNGADDDGDGRADCADDACASAAACASPNCPGDPACPAETETDCTDGLDGDGDGDVDCADADCQAEGACLPPFELEAHTAMTPENTLSLETNLPARVADCLAVPAQGVPCADNDRDGLADAWEDLVLQRFQPVQRFDEDESLISDPGFVLANVGRVALASEAPLEVRVFVMLGYSRDYGSCSFTAHSGDSERVALALEARSDGGPGDVQVVAAYTAAHEGTSTDHGRVFTGADLSTELRFTADPDTAEPRWLVFPSSDKHATYASLEICEGISVVPCFDEDCGPDGVADPGAYDSLSPVVNAGEEQNPLVTDLGPIGFPGDDAWAMQNFCGGLGGDNCTSPVREKLLNDPFTGL